MSMYGKYKNVVGPLPVDKWPVTDCSKDPGFTVQADRDDADINKIVSRFMKSGQLPPALRGEPFYGDVSEFGDLQDSLIKVQEANALFMTYPAEVRERFDNDPALMIDFWLIKGIVRKLRIWDWSLNGLSCVQRRRPVSLALLQHLGHRPLNRAL